MTHRLTIGGALNLFGPVGFRDSEDEGFTVSDVTEALAEMAGNITVRINSGGGRTFDGIAIYNALKRHSGTVTTVTQGIAASAASLVFMAGDTRVVAEGAMLMISDASGITVGTEIDQLSAAAALGKLSNSMAGIYAKGTGRTASVERAAMRAETWLNGAEAVRIGFATKEIDTGAVMASAFDYRIYAHAPDFLVKRARDMAERFDREAAAHMFAAPRQPPKENDKMKAPKPRLVTTRDGWKAEFEQSPALQAEFIQVEDYVAYMAADAKGLIKILRR